MARVLLLLPSATYRAPDFLAAARALGVEVVVGSETRQTLADRMQDRAVVVPMDDPVAAEEAILTLHARAPLDAVVAVDDQGALVGARVGARLGLPASNPDAVAATRDKAEMRRRLAAARVPQPAFLVLDEEDPLPHVPLPCVVKPLRLSASRGVIRVDDPAQLDAARRRVTAIAGGGPLLVETYVPGDEVAVEGVLSDGALSVLAIFDKPDPLVGPYFEETLYVTPSRHSPTTRARIEALTGDAARAIGLTEGPVHAEIRVAGDDAWVIELAARTIGGLCARALRFGAGISLEEVVLRHALRRPLDGIARETEASGVMMLPIPRRGVLAGVHNRDTALAVPGIVGLEITVPIGREIVPLPEGDRYLGFLFARADAPDAVEQALRTAHAELDVVIEADT